MTDERVLHHSSVETLRCMLGEGVTAKTTHSARARLSLRCGAPPPQPQHYISPRQVLFLGAGHRAHGSGHYRVPFGGPLAAGELSVVPVPRTRCCNSCYSAYHGVYVRTYVRVHHGTTWEGHTTASSRRRWHENEASNPVEQASQQRQRAVAGCQRVDQHQPHRTPRRAVP
jgi:hypothetical protein